jgi:NADH dehydrogenase
VKLILLQSAEKILPEMKPSLAEFAHRQLERRGLEIRLNTRLTAVTEQTADTQHKPTSEAAAIPTRTVVATVPVEPHPLLKTLPLTKLSGRIAVNSELHCDEAPRIWALGDCAAIPLGDGKLAPPTAQHAVREAQCCAKNIVASLRGNSLKSYDFRTLGTLASLGRRSAVADVMGIKISGVLAWILWRMIYVSKFPGWDRKARIIADWTMDLLLPRDIAQVRIFQSAQVRREHFEPGEVVFNQGDIGDRVYFIISGEADIVVDGRQAAVVETGAVIGEIALIVDKPRTATVRARTALNMASVSRDAFHTLVTHLPGVKAAMNEVLKSHIEPASENRTPTDDPLPTSA